MDVKKIINGIERTFCLPASQYVAGKIAHEFHEGYDIEAELKGTGANLKKYSKYKVVNFYDKENIEYMRTQQPPTDLGGFWWEAANDLAVYYKTHSDKENEILKEKNLIVIPFDVIKNLRPEDIVEITAVDTDKDGKEEKIKFKAKKKYIENMGNISNLTTDIPLFLVPKTAFVRFPIPAGTKRRSASCKSSSLSHTGTGSAQKCRKKYRGELDGT